MLYVGDDKYRVYVGSERRRIVTQSEGFEIPYITSGLVFYLDGIEKGSDSSAWTDIINGDKFPYISRTTISPTSVTFGSGAEFTSNTQPHQLVGTEGTIEVCASSTKEANIILTQATTDKLCFITRNSSSLKIINFYYNTGSSSMNAYELTIPTLYTASVNVDRCVVNGDSYQSKRHYNYNMTADGRITIGNRNGGGGTGNYFQGELYAIRIYNRLLTEQEMLSNQRIDNQRFNLGLTI